MKTQVLSPCYGPAGTERIAERFIHSARHFGYPEPTLYGLGRLSPGSPHGGDMQGTWVIEEMRKSDADVIIACDCSDVLFSGPMDEMLEKFRAFNSGFVIGTDLSSHVRGEEIELGMRQLQIEAGGYYGGLNIGYWIGTRDYAIETLQKSIDLYRGTPGMLDNPQAWLPLGMVRKTIDFVLDRNAVIFQPCSAGDIGAVRIENGRLHNTETGTMPCCVHFNGCAGNLTAYNDMYEALIR